MKVYGVGDPVSTAEAQPWFNALTRGCPLSARLNYVILAYKKRSVIDLFRPMLRHELQRTTTFLPSYYLHAKVAVIWRLYGAILSQELLTVHISQRDLACS